MIPLFKLDFDEQEENAVLEVLRSKWISTGPKNAEFEKAFAKQLNTTHALALNNCTAALHIALRVLDIGEGDEVIVPSLTFVATANAVRFVGAKPIFCDIISEEDLTICPEHLESLITDKTKAIIVMHYAGFACDMDKILSIAKKYSLKVIEDACHGPLANYKNQKLGTIGDIGCFSFFSNKNISTGEGGMLVTENTKYIEKAKAMRSHGMTILSYQKSKGHTTAYDVSELGYNYRMDDIRAALGCIQLKKTAIDIQRRQLVRKLYESRLSEIDEIVVPFLERKDYSSNYIFPIVLKNSNKEKRDTLRKHLHEKGIQTSVHYPPVHKFSLYSENSKVLTKTESVSAAEITLPMYGSLKKEEISIIVDAIKSGVTGI